MFISEGAEQIVDMQFIKCDCGHVEIRFNQAPLPNCPKCGKSLEDILDAEYITEE